jgi:hypothetical protein
LYLVGILLAAGNSTSRAILDVNTNQISDVWEAAYNCVGLAPDADSDSDGSTAFEESVAGTDPYDASSVLRLRVTGYLRSGHLVRWASVEGKRYQLEASVSPADGTWVPLDPPVTGTGDEVLGALPQNDPPFTGFRVALLTDNTAVSNARPYLGTVDTDLDGSPDIDEWAAGTNPFDPGSRLSVDSVTVGDAVLLSWPSVAGKRYQVERTHSILTEPWVPEGGSLEGTGSPLTSTVEVNDSPHWFRVQVADSDTDSDSVSDWEEKFTGLEFGPWHYRTNFPTDPAIIAAILTATNVVNIEPLVPVANATRQVPGTVVVSRSGNLGALTIHYSVGGSATAGVHYAPLSGSVVLPPGVHTSEIVVTPLAETGLDPSRSVVLTLSPGAGYVVGTNALAQVNVLREAPLVVTDFGAVGDGVTDDTLAIQAAVNALEASGNHNRLHFPAGVYRLNTPQWITTPVGNYYQLLELGKSDLTGRDLFITGDEGAVLYSTTSPLRARMLVARAKLRSLWFLDLTWRKDGDPLSATTGEPNGADGVFIRYDDQRQVEMVSFEDCTFENCHRAITTSANTGFDTRGLLRRFAMRRCRVLNPYGSNTLEAQTAFGGGQQVLVAPWVGWALYTDNIFDGGAAGAYDPVRNPLGIRKDGCHFGSPLSLIFTNNVALRMGVEAVAQIDDPYMGTTATSLTFPPPDGVTSAQVTIHPTVTTFFGGHILNFRTPLTPTTEPQNALMTVVAYDETNRVLTVTNPGLSPGVDGTVLPPSRPIYSQDYNPTLATITDNVVLGGSPIGHIGVNVNARALVARNLVEGYATGIYIYPAFRNPLNSPVPGTLLDSNVILTKDSTGGLQAYGVESFGPGEIIAGNLIVAPRSYRFVGTTVRTTNAWVEGNTVLPIQVVRNGYNVSTRSVGIAFGNGSSSNTAAANSTYGLDVGIGPENPFQGVPHRVLSHFSTNDVLAVDPIGMMP